MGVDEGNLLVMGVERYLLTSSSYSYTKLFSQSEEMESVNWNLSIASVENIAP